MIALFLPHVEKLSLSFHRIITAIIAFERDVSEPTQNSLYEEVSRQTIRIPGASLDELIDAQQLGSPVLMKIDIQGSEPYVFTDGKLCLEKTDVVIMEYWPYGIRRLGFSLDDFLGDIAWTFPFGAILSSKLDKGLQFPKSLSSINLREIDSIVAELKAFAGAATWEHAEIFLAKKANANAWHA